MTGRDMIIYILKNKLEDAEVLNGIIVPGLVPAEVYAAKINAGYATVEALYSLGKVSGCRIGKQLYIWDKTV